MKFLKQFFFNIFVFTLFYYLLSFDSLLDIEFYKNYFTSWKIVAVCAAAILDVFLKNRREQKKNINNNPTQ